MLSAVILVLREVVEAALIISLLLALTYNLRLTRRWSLVAFIGGCIGSWLLAKYAYAIAGAFDGVGQELLNNLIYLVVIVCVYCICVITLPLVFVRRTPSEGASGVMQPLGLSASVRSILFGLLIITVSLPMAREGSEIYIYLSSFTAQPDALSSVLLGGAIGAGIGLSLGAIAYYAFIFCPDKIFLPIFFITISLIIGGLSMQIVKAFMQIGWLESEAPLWDSSWLVSEVSLTGELLYALIGYEAKPTLLQVLVYSLTVIPVPLLLLWYGIRARGSHRG
jgi:high-affinity iron transporter